MENPYTPPMTTVDNEPDDRPVESQPEPNGLFLQLAVVAILMSIAPIIAWLMSMTGDRALAYSPGAPRDYPILLGYILCLAVASVVNLFLTRGSLRVLGEPYFWKSNLRNVHLTVIVWAVFCGGLCWAIDERAVRIVGEKEWFQIAIVTFSASLQFLLWHAMATRRTVPPMR